MSSSFKKLVKKYEVDKKTISRLAKKISDYNECIEVSPVKNIGDPIIIDISISYLYDDELVNVMFYYEGNSGYTYDLDPIDQESRITNEEQELLCSICRFLDEHYPI